jgi:hypothetical protein
VLRYRDLLEVENLFLRTKAIMRTRPIFHSSDAAIRGHVFCSFLALAMQKHLDDLSREAGVTPEWKDLSLDLDRLQHVHLVHRVSNWLVRTDATANVSALFRRAHIAMVDISPLLDLSTLTELNVLRTPRSPDVDATHGKERNSLVAWWCPKCG